MGLSTEEYEDSQIRDTLEITITINAKDKNVITQISNHFN